MLVGPVDERVDDASSRGRDQISEGDTARCVSCGISRTGEVERDRRRHRCQSTAAMFSRFLLVGGIAAAIPALINLLL